MPNEPSRAMLAMRVEELTRQCDKLYDEIKVQRRVSRLNIEENKRLHAEIEGMNLALALRDAEIARLVATSST